MSLSDYLELHLDQDEDIDLTSYIEHVGNQHRFAFNRRFKKQVDNILSCSTDNNSTEKSSTLVRNWAQEVVENEYEILDRVDVIKYWNTIEKQRFQENLKYQTIVQLNDEAVLECKVIIRKRYRRYFDNEPKKTKRSKGGDED